MPRHEIPSFPYLRDPWSAECLAESSDACECCGIARGVLYRGPIYAVTVPKAICPWCVADGSAAAKYDADFHDAFFADSAGNSVVLDKKWHDAVFRRTIGFDTYNPIEWWVHCGEPAEYVTRGGSYDLIYECRVCHERHVVQDLD